MCSCGEYRNIKAGELFLEGLLKASHKDIKKHLTCKIKWNAKTVEEN